MKTMFLFGVSAAVIMLAAFSCTKELEVEITPVETPEETVQGKTYTIIVNAEKGEPETKALNLEGNILSASWKQGEEVDVYKGEKIGTLTAQSTGTSTTLKGTITGELAEGDKLTLKFCSPSYANQDGTLEYIAANCDYATAEVDVSGIDEGAGTLSISDATFISQQAIVKFNLRDKDDSSDIQATSLTFSADDMEGDIHVTSSAPASELFVAIPAIDNQAVFLQAITSGNTASTYGYHKSSATFTRGKYYAITVKMTKAIIVRNNTELNAANSDGNYIIFANDITREDNRPLTVSGNVTIDLAGHTLNRLLGSVDNEGSVIIVTQDGNLTLSDGTVSGGWHVAGGGGMINHGTATISNCNFRSNVATTRGGAIWSDGNLTVKNCTFFDNKAFAEGGDDQNEGDGGAIHLESGKATLTDVTITNNLSKDAGGIYVNSGVTLDLGGTSTISGNKSSKHGGGGIVNYGTVTISGCSFSNNTASTRGGAIWSNGSLTVENCTFTENKALESDGGAIHLEGGEAKFTDVTITGNTSKDAGGIYVNSGVTLDLGGTSTISSNTSSEHGGGGIVNYGTTNLSGSVIITGNTCHTNGAGIWSNGTLKMEGDIQVKGNTNDDIYLKSNRKIILTDALTSGIQSIGICMEKPYYFTEGYENGQQFFNSGTFNDVVYKENEEVRMGYSYFERSWDENTNELVTLKKTLGAQQNVFNVCGLVDPEHGGYLNGDSGWYVVDGKISLKNSNSSVTCTTGTVVNLILCNGAEFETCGFYVNASTTLNIYSQSYVSDIAGKLISDNSGRTYFPGIGGEKIGMDMSMGTLNIHGGTITAKGGHDAAGIGGSQGFSCGSITIYGGDIEAKGGVNGAGIGGGEQGSGNNITIYGGKVTGTGGNMGAGIGGGCPNNGKGGDCENLVIWGGDITGNGGNCAAGIGGGEVYNDTPQKVSITIHDGNVHGIGGGRDNDYGYPGGAGIGGGRRGSISRITINGGTVYGEAQYDGAGIGAGGDASQAADGGAGEDGIIIINGGDVRAIGGKGTSDTYAGGAGIGAGGKYKQDDAGNGGRVVIRGGKITAQGGTGSNGNGAAIGHGGGSTENGNLILDALSQTGYTVLAGDNADSAISYSYNEWVTACRMLWASITPTN